MEILTQLLVFASAFERIPSFELMGLTVRSSTFIILLALLIIIISFKKNYLKLSQIDKSILVFYAICFLSIIGAQDHRRAIMVWLQFGFILIAYFLISRALRGDLKFKKLGHWLVAAAVASAIFAIWQFIGDTFGISTAYTLLGERYTGAVFGFARVQAFALEPLYFANFLLLPILYSANKIIGYRKIEKKQFVIFSVMFLSFILTLSRGGFVALVIGGIGLLVILAYKKSLYNLSKLITCIIICCTFAFGLIYYASKNTGVERFISHSIAQGEMTGESTYGRLDNYIEALRLFKTKPILGIGLGNYGVETRLVKNVADSGYQIVNNQYLETLAETGVVGLLSFFALIFFVISALAGMLKKNFNSWFAVMLCAFVAFLIQYNFFSTIYILDLWIIIAIIDGITYNTNSLKDNE